MSDDIRIVRFERGWAACRLIGGKLQKLTADTVTPGRAIADLKSAKVYQDVQ